MYMWMCVQCMVCEKRDQWTSHIHTITDWLTDTRCKCVYAVWHTHVQTHTHTFEWSHYAKLYQFIQHVVCKINMSDCIISIALSEECAARALEKLINFDKYSFERVFAHVCLKSVAAFCLSYCSLSHFHVFFFFQFHSLAIACCSYFFHITHRSLAQLIWTEWIKSAMQRKKNNAHTHKLIMALKKIPNEPTQFYFFSKFVCHCWKINGRKSWILIKSPAIRTVDYWLRFFVDVKCSTVSAAASHLKTLVNKISYVQVELNKWILWMFW